jgi:hypothetical protein
MLINTIVDMVLISIHPFAVRKIFLLAVALLGLSSAFCFADPVFMTRQYLPSYGEVRISQSAAVLVPNHHGSTRVRPSLPALSDRRGDIRLLAYSPLWDETNLGMHSILSGKNGSPARNAGMLASEGSFDFAITHPESGPGSY